MEGTKAERFVSERRARRINSFPETPPDHRITGAVPQRMERNGKTRKNGDSRGLDQ